MRLVTRNFFGKKGTEAAKKSEIWPAAAPEELPNDAARAGSS